MNDLDKAKEELNKLIDRYNKHKEDKGFIGNEDQAGQSLIRPLIRDILHYDVEDPSEFKIGRISENNR